MVKPGMTSMNASYATVYTYIRTGHYSMSFWYITADLALFDVIFSYYVIC